MNPVHKYLSSIVKTELPAFYQEYGPVFVDFIYAYFLWLEETGQLNNIVRNLPENKAIDTTEDEFLAHFKAKYLTGVELTDTDGIRRLIRHSKDFYDSKGSERSFQLLFQLLYNDKVTVYYPNDQVLKPSYGDFYKPQYLELEVSANSAELVGQQVTGSISGATAFIEKFTRREISGRYFDVLYLSDIVGDFVRGEQIVIAGEMSVNPPRMFGSLTSLLIEDGGANNNIGDIFEVSSDSGRGALARVSNTQNATGRVNFQLVDGGYGFTTNAETTVSEFVFGAQNFSSPNTFYQFEQISQNISNVSFFGNASNFSNGLFVTGWNTGSPVGNGVVVSSSVVNSTYGNIKIQVTEGSFATAADVGSTGNTANGIVDVVGNVMATANLLGFTSNSIGVVNSVNTFYVLDSGKTFLRGLSSNATANITSKSLGSGADFQIGSLSPTESVFLFTDMLRDRNTGNVPYMNIMLDGKNANIGFVEGVSVGQSLAYTKLFSFTEDFTGTEIIDQVTVTNSGAIFPGTISVAPTSLRVDGTSTLFATRFLEREYLQIANSTAFDFIPITSIINNTEAYISRPSRVTGSGLSYGKAVVIARGDNANANSTVLTNYNLTGTIATGNSTQNLILGVSSYALGQVDTLTVFGGTGYDNVTSSVTFANGTPTVAANATAIVTNSTGGILSVTMNNQGSGYDQDANVAITGGTGANLKVRMDYGYGFPKDPNAGLPDLMKRSLTSNTFTIGTIASLANVTPGSNYNRSPIVVVIEPLIAGFSRRDFIGSITDQTGSFIQNETLTQNIATSTVRLTFTGITGNTAFDQNEYLYQGNISIPNAFGYVYTQNSTTVTLANVTGTFVNTSNTLTQLRGIVSNTTANITGQTLGDVYSTSRGTVISSNATHLVINRTSFNTNFALNTLITGQTSGATANLVFIVEDTNSAPLGFNANVTANVVTANGVATELQIIDSGFGFWDDELTTLVNEDNNFNITAYSNTINQGIGEGQFQSHRGWLNEAIVHDNDRYQTHSYVIQSSLSMDKYESVVKNLLHVAGTRMFGDVNKQTTGNVAPTIQTSSVTAV